MNPLHRCLFSFNAINRFSHLLILLVCVYILENVASWLDAMMPIWIKSLPFPAPASPLCSWLGLMNCCHPFSFSTLIVFCVSLCGLIPDTFWTHSYLPSSVVEMLLRYFCFVAGVVANTQDFKRVIHTMPGQFRFNIFATVSNQCLLHFLRSTPPLKLHETPQ